MLRGAQWELGGPGDRRCVQAVPHTPDLHAGQGQWAGPGGTGRRPPTGPAGAAALATALAPEVGG